MNIQDKIEAYINRHSDKSEILIMLRAIMLESELQETIKWGIPVYTLEGKNVVGIAAFKAYAALWFYQGALLADKHHVLVNAQEGKTQALRQWRFTSVNEHEPDLIRSYVQEAIKHQKAGRQVKIIQPKALALPPMFADKLDADQALAKAYESLSQSKQREYVAYIVEAKKEETKMKRLEKIIPMILAGTGLNDRYK